MQNYINTLAQNLKLSPYQSKKLMCEYGRYNMSRLEKRGGVLYAPYQSRGFCGWIRRMVFGARADLIGENKVLLRAQRNIKFRANGYHSVRIGRHVYYADAMGNVVSYKQFLENAGRY